MQRVKKFCPKCHSANLYHSRRLRNYRCVKCNATFKTPIAAKPKPEIEITHLRKCACCKKEMTVSKFYTSINGYVDSYCKDCRKEKQREYRDKADSKKRIK